MQLVYLCGTLSNIGINTYALITVAKLRTVKTALELGERPDYTLFEKGIAVKFNDFFYGISSVCERK